MPTHALSRSAARRRTAILSSPNTKPVSYVSFDGPEPMQDETGDEVPCWTVSTCKEDDTIVELYDQIRSFDDGFELAERLAKELRVECLCNADRP